MSTAGYHTYGPTCQLAAPLPSSAPAGSDSPPPIRAQFFHQSALPIDDPLSPLPPPATTSPPSVRYPLQPFAGRDNAALEEAWLGLDASALREGSRHCKRPCVVKRKSLTPGQYLQSLELTVQRIHHGMTELGQYGKVGDWILHVQSQNYQQKSPWGSNQRPLEGSRRISPRKRDSSVEPMQKPRRRDHSRRPIRVISVHRPPPMRLLRAAVDLPGLEHCRTRRREVYSKSQPPARRSFELLYASGILSLHYVSPPSSPQMPRPRTNTDQVHALLPSRDHPRRTERSWEASQRQDPRALWSHPAPRKCIGPCRYP